MYRIEYQEDMASIVVRGGRIIVDKEDDWVFKDKYCWRSDEPKGYIQGYYWDLNWIKINIGLSRLLMNCPEGMDVDHINHNPMDNRKSNLRICTRSQNLMNTRKSSGKGSVYKGVYYATGKKSPWIAQITLNSKRIYLGSYISEELAAKVYDRKAKELFGEFACLNFSSGSTE